LLFVGALDARKDPAGLLRAWQVSRAAGADTELVLAGSASLQTPGGMGLARQLGYLDHSALVDVYSAATCLVFPSRYEGFGLPVLEAMACGCPVVAYDNSSLPEVGGEAAMLVTDGDAEALGRAASDIALSKDLAARLRSKGLAWAAKFSWNSAARATVGAYERLLHHARRR
jgi:glycosyltransferase involved in cell wall biosynthesis